MNKFLRGVVVLILLIVIIFIIQNLSIVPINFLFWSFEVRRIWLVFLLFSAGLLSGCIMMWLMQLQIDMRSK